jgi:hypothetical protein
MATYALVRQGAFIDKYIGDAVMAFFNVPIRYDDHGARAVAAAREIQGAMPSLSERFGLPLQASIGIAAGWARVGRIGSGDGRDYTAIGDVVNLAARLQGKARAGEILIDRDVYAQVATELPDLAPESLELKGFKQAVAGYRLGGAASRPSTDQARVFPRDPERRRRAVSLGSVIFALLGAPCAAASLIGPLAVVLGFGSLFSAFGASVLSVLDQGPIRLPLLTLAALGALANLYTVWKARQLRRQEAAAGQLVVVTRLERRRALLVTVLACACLLAVAYELYAHQFITHHPWP